MITIFKNKKDIPQDMEYVELNDLYFNQNTAAHLDDKAEWIINQIDEAVLVGKYKIRSRFDDMILDTDKLSVGCKTVLNVVYNPNKVFCLKECGNNALIPFEMEAVIVQTSFEKKEIRDYEALKEWWSNEE